MPVYRREGNDPHTSWNEVIRRINQLVAECPGVEKLDAVQPDHIFRRSDIEEAQNKLSELCNDNEFDSVPALWRKETIDALIAAIEAGACCCEDQDRPFGPANFFSTASSLYFTVSGGRTVIVKDWAEPLMSSGGDPDPETGQGGFGWVGNEFSQWEVWLYTDATGPVAPIASGNVIDGFIDLGYSGLPLGAPSDSVVFGYRIDFDSTIPPSGGPTIGTRWRVSEFHTGNEMFVDVLAGNSFDNALGTPGFVNPAWPASPYVVELVTAGVEHNGSVYVRLLCQ